MGNAGTERRIYIRWFAGVLGKRRYRAPNEKDQIRPNSVRHQHVAVRRVLCWNNPAIHVCSPIPAHPEFVHRPLGSAKLLPNNLKHSKVQTRSGQAAEEAAADVNIFTDQVTKNLADDWQNRAGTVLLWPAK